MENGKKSAFAYAPTYEHGLTKREYFAGLAMQAVIANGKYSEIEISGSAVIFADALLKALEK